MQEGYRGIRYNETAVLEVRLITKLLMKLAPPAH